MKINKFLYIFISLSVYEKIAYKNTVFTIN
jgi:hypothetical protein